MKKHTRFVALILLLFGPPAYSVEVDVNDVVIINQGGGVFLYLWELSGTGITQLEPGGTYTVDVEFLPGQLFNLQPNPTGNETIDLSFGSDNGPAVIDPGLVQSSGSVEVTGVVGNFNGPNPAPLDPLVFLGNFAGGDPDFIVPIVTGDLTTDGFFFHDSHFTFTLDNQGAPFPVDFVRLALIGGAPVPITSDLWDISQGTVVTSDSGVLPQSDIRNVFGGAFGIIPPFDQFANGFFEDGLPEGTVHQVEWQTTEPIELTTFNLFANHDVEATQRGFSNFKLFAQNSTTCNFELLAEVSPSNPYGDTPGNMGTGSALGLAIDVTPTVAQVFRAEFTQWGAMAPRVGELDGFGFKLDSPDSVCNDSSIAAWWVIFSKPRAED